ncbi:MAG: GNAT family N-acetyltransferase [Clostridia bacterium]|nr:GNAT family N-acetyltransferase [Clostridia bacterium]
MMYITQQFDVKPVTDFYNRMRNTSKDGLCLRPITEETAAWWFFGRDRVSFAAVDENEMVGFVSGVYLPERKTGYLSYLCIAPEHRGQGIARNLMDRAEEGLLAFDGCEKLDVVFHNPVNLPWYVAEDGGHYHPCVPGVDASSGLFDFLAHRGWNEFVRQNAYYRPLEGYTDPPQMAEVRAGLGAAGIEVTLYNPDKHHGLAELFDNIGNPGWKAQVMANTDKPIVVAVDHNANDLVVAYTGPLSVSEGRGNFCGIGTRKEYRGRGIGKVVFCEMCTRHAQNGGEFMSLYTGANNPARNIYEAAGFYVVRSFANMRKMK